MNNPVNESRLYEEDDVEILEEDLEYYKTIFDALLENLENKSFHKKR